jgi:hypothetical protein
VLRSLELVVRDHGSASAAQHQVGD